MLLQPYYPSIQRSKAGGQWIQAALSHTGRFCLKRQNKNTTKNNHSILISTLNSRNINQYSKIFIWNRTWIPNYQSSSSAISCLHSSPSTAFSVPTAYASHRTDYNSFWKILASVFHFLTQLFLWTEARKTWQTHNEPCYLSSLMALPCQRDKSKLTRVAF